MKRYMQIKGYVIILVLTFSQAFCQIPTTPEPQQAPATAPVALPLPTPAPAASPTPVAIPTPTAPQPEPAQPAATPQAQTSPTANVAPVKTTPASPSNYEKEFDEIYQNLNKVNETKKALKKQLNEVEEKLDGARKMAIDSKKASFDVVQQANTADAEALIAQVDKNLQSLKDTQKSLRDVELPKFEITAKQIEDLTTAIQSKVDELRSKGLKFQISQAQLELQKQQPLSSENPVTPGTPSTANPPSQTNKTIWQKTYDTSVEWMASGINITKKGWNKLKNWVYSPEQKSEQKYDEGKKNPKLDIASDATIKTIVAELENVVKQFDEIQIFMIQKYAALKRKAKNIELVAKSNDEFFKYYQKIDEKNPAWKESAVNAFSSTIDGTIVIGKAIKKATVKVYDTCFSGFAKDVKTKINEQQKQAEPAK